MPTIRRTHLTTAAALLISAGLTFTAPLAASAAPTPVSGPTSGGTIVSDLLPGVDFTSVSGGFNFTAALASDGHLYAWGDNELGQLGRGTVSGVETMGPVHTPAGVTFTDVYSGVEFAFATASDGKTYAWGDNQYGQLGDGTTTSTSPGSPSGTRTCSLWARTATPTPGAPTPRGRSVTAHGRTGSRPCGS